MMEKHRKLLRRHKCGYEVWRETSAVQFKAAVISDPHGDAQELADAIQQPSVVTLNVAYTPEGNYIGDTKRAHFLCKKRGIKPELINGHKVCSIGYCEAERKWYGWSHRAIYGFGVGDTVEEGDCCASSGWTAEYLAEHAEEDTSLPVGFTAHSLDDAKRMAVAFAESVS